LFPPELSSLTYVPAGVDERERHLLAHRLEHEQHGAERLPQQREARPVLGRHQVPPLEPHHVDVAAPPKPPYSEMKKNVAKRDGSLARGGRERLLERGANPKLSRRTCTCEYGLQSCRGNEAAVKSGCSEIWESSEGRGGVPQQADAEVVTCAALQLLT
jgi:hypothetical protein